MHQNNKTIPKSDEKLYIHPHTLFTRSKSPAARRGDAGYPCFSSSNNPSSRAWRAASLLVLPPSFFRILPT